MSQASELARPFPAKYVKDNPTGYGSYVAHHIVNQRLLQVLGPFSWELVQVIRGDVAAIIHTDPKKAKPALSDVVVGVYMRLAATIDGQRVVVEEPGDCEQPHNWPHDGARLKDASSDALKRCAMRLGLGLHVWSQGDYYLYDALTRDKSSASHDAGETQTPGLLGTGDGVDVGTAAPDPGEAAA